MNNTANLPVNIINGTMLRHHSVTATDKRHAAAVMSDIDVDDVTTARREMRCAHAYDGAMILLNVSWSQHEYWHRSGI